MTTNGEFPRSEQLSSRSLARSTSGEFVRTSQTSRASAPLGARARVRRRWLLLFCGVLCCSACDRREAITKYTVPRDDTKTSTPTAKRDDRMIVGLALYEDTAWFFKLVGQQDDVEAMRASYLDFLKSIRFGADALGVPEWDAPEDWQRMPGTSFRFATYATPNGLEVAISKLGYPGQLDSYLRANVDRWRREMDLPPVPVATEIQSELEELPLESGQLFVLELDGAYSGGAMAGGPMAGGPMAPPTGPPPTDVTTSGSEPSNITDFDVPEGWTAGGTTSISRIAFVYSDEAGTAKFTATPLPASANRWEDNAARWAGQAGVELSPEEVMTQTQIIQIDGRDAQSIELPAEAFGDEPTDLTGQGLIGVMVKDGDTAWFLKLAGDRKTVVDQRDAFFTFVESIKFGQE